MPTCCSHAVNGAARAVHRAAHNTITHRFRHWNRLACDHAFFNQGLALGHDAIGGNFLTWFDADQIPDPQVRRCHLPFGPILQEGGGVRAQFHEAANSCARLTARAKFQKTSQEDQGDDDRSGLEIDETAGFWD